MIHPYPETALRLGELHRADMLPRAEAERLYAAAMEKTGRHSLAHLAVRMLRSRHRRDDTPTDGGATRDARRAALGAAHP